jgi:hypothetical protein
MERARLGRSHRTRNRRRQFRSTVSALFFVAVLAWPAHADETAGGATRFDFESSALGKHWTAAGRIRVVRAELPEAAPAGLKEGEGPSGHAVTLDAEGPGMLYTKAGAVAGDWQASEEVAFWLYASGKEETPVIEVRAIEADAKARFWRKFEVDHRGWKEIRLPMAWFRESDGRMPQWSRIAHLGFYLRGKGSIALDDIRLVDADPKAGAERTVDDVLPLAFPAAAKDKVRVKRSDRAVVATNAEQLDLDALAAHLEKVADAIDEDFAFLPKDGPPGVLFVFAADDEYRAFVPRFAQRLGGETPRPGSDGFTTHGVAASSWDAEKGSLRPVYCHEFVHSYLGPRLLLANKGEWFHEGAASWYQLRFHPQTNFTDLVRRELARGEGPPSFDAIGDGEKLPMPRYWQAATAIGLLVSDEHHRKRLPKLVEGFQQSASTKITPHWQSALDTTEEAFRGQWRAFLAKQYLDASSQQ